MCASCSLPVIDPDLAAQVGGDELVDRAVQDGAGVAGLHVRAEVLHHLVRVQDVGPDLAPPLDLLLGVVDGVAPRLLFLLADLVEAALAFRRLKRRKLKVQNESEIIALLTKDNDYGENFIRALDDPK